MENPATIVLITLSLTAWVAHRAHKRYGKWWLTALYFVLGFIVIQIVVGFALAFLSLAV